jgi:ribosomal protein S21
MDNPKVEQRPVEPLKLNGIRVEVRPADGKEAQMYQLEKAMKIFKKKLEKDGVLFEVRDRRYFTKPSVVERTRIKKLNPKKKRTNK